MNLGFFLLLHSPYNAPNKKTLLRLERGGGQQIFLSCACFLITQQYLVIYRHAIHQSKAGYHSYLMVSVILYNSSEVKLKIVKEIKTKHRFLLKYSEQLYRILSALQKILLEGSLSQNFELGPSFVFYAINLVKK